MSAKAFNIGWRPICSECGYTMMCDQHDGKSLRVKAFCQYSLCTEYFKRYWLPLQVIELEPVNENPAPQ